MNISTNLCWASVKIYRWKQRLQARGAVVCWKANADGGSAEWSSAGVREFRSAGAGGAGPLQQTSLRAGMAAGTMNVICN